MSAVPDLPRVESLEELIPLLNERLRRLGYPLLYLTGDLDARGYRIINLGAPQNPNDAARLIDITNRGRRQEAPTQIAYQRADGARWAVFVYWDTLSVESEVGNPYQVRLLTNEKMVFEEWSIAAYDIPTGTDMIIDVQRRPALGAWESMFPDGAANKLVLPAGNETNFLTIFRDPPIHPVNGDWLRPYVVQVGSAAPGGRVEVRGRFRIEKR